MRIGGPGKDNYSPRGDKRRAVWAQVKGQFFGSGKQGRLTAVSKRKSLRAIIERDFSTLEEMIQGREILKQC